MGTEADDKEGNLYTDSQPLLPTPLSRQITDLSSNLTCPSPRPHHTGKATAGEQAQKKMHPLFARKRKSSPARTPSVGSDKDETTMGTEADDKEGNQPRAKKQHREKGTVWMGKALQTSQGRGAADCQLFFGRAT